MDGNRTVRLWDIGNSRKPAIVATFGAARQVGALSMSADSRRAHDGDMAETELVDTTRSRLCGNNGWFTAMH